MSLTELQVTQAVQAAMQPYMEEMKRLVEDMGKLTVRPSPVAASAAPKAKRTAAQPASDGGCEYIFSRGDKKDQRCGMPKSGGTNFCRVCVKKKKVSGGGATTKVAGNFPASAASSAKEAGNSELEATQWTGPADEKEKELFLVLKSRFLVRQDDKGVIIVMGKESGGRRIPLTAAEEVEATTMGMKLPPPSPVVPAILSGLTAANGGLVVPAIPQIPGITAK